MEENQVSELQILRKCRDPHNIYQTDSHIHDIDGDLIFTTTTSHDEPGHKSPRRSRRGIDRYRDIIMIRVILTDEYLPLRATNYKTFRYPSDYSLVKMT